MTARPLAFADAIRRRHRARTTSRRPGTLTLRRYPRPAAQRRTAVTVVHAPRVTQVLTAVHRHEHAGERMERHVRHERSHATTLVERLLLRRERVERAPAPAHIRVAPAARASRPEVATAAAGATATAPEPVLPTAPPPQTTVLRRLVVAPPAAPGEAVAPPRSADAFPAAPPGRPADPPAVPSPTDVGRLADAVIGVLDQRIVAQRERLGRP